MKEVRTDLQSASPSNPGPQTPASILQLLGISCEFASPSSSSSSSTAAVQRAGHRHRFPMTLHLPSFVVLVSPLTLHVKQPTLQPACLMPIWAALISITLTSPSCSVTVFWNGQRHLCESLEEGDG